MPTQQDLNSGEIVSALRAAGCFVRFIAFAHGIAGCPDILVARDGKLWLLEIKGPRGRLSAAQVKFHAEWIGPPIAIVKTPEEAFAAIGLAVERRQTI